MAEAKTAPPYQENYPMAANQQYYSPQGQTSPGPQMQQPHMQMQQQQYQTATPLHSLSMGATPVDCPSCGTRAMTRITYENGNTTFAWAFGLCVCACLGCIPFLMNSLKDVVHHCGNCGCRLATWHRSGAVEVHVHA